MSASRSRSPADARSPVAIPMLAVTVTGVSSSPSLNGSLSASSSRSATSSGPAISDMSAGDHHELVAAEAPERVDVAHDAVEPRGDRLAAAHRRRRDRACR